MFKPASADRQLLRVIAFLIGVMLGSFTADKIDGYGTKAEVAMDQRPTLLRAGFTD